MSASQDIMMVPLVSPSVESMAPTFASTASNYSSALQNIQFFIKSAQGLPEPPAADIRKRRIVRASCSSKHEQYRTNASTSYTWEDNTSQIGPVRVNDQIIFSVELHAPLQVVKRFANTVASSLPYNIDTLLEMQAKAGVDENIVIPLQVNKKHDNQEAFLFLCVKQPTATFISKQWQEEAERLSVEKEEREGRLSGSSSTRASSSDPSLTLQLDAEKAKRREIVKGKQPEV